MSKIDTNIKSCDDNKLFVRVAQKCFDDFKSLRKSTANDLAGRFAKGDQDKQRKDFADHAANNQEAIAAHKYLISLGELAVSELDGYFDYMEHPEDAENDDEILSEPCFIENATALENIVNDFEDEVDTMKEAKEIEKVHSAISSQNKQQIDASSTNLKIKSTTGKGSGTIKAGTTGNRESDVSGVEESKKKNEQKK
ncbi:MAG: hypothetical protein AB7K68_11100 [Bacteriovoracia bacterium]